MVPQYAGDEDIWRNHYHNKLRSDIREHVSYSTCPAMDSMIAREKEREIGLEHIRKRKAEEGQVTGVSGKKPKRSNTRKKPKGSATGNVAGYMRGLLGWVIGLL